MHGHLGLPCCIGDVEEPDGSSPALDPSSPPYSCCKVPQAECCVCCAFLMVFSPERATGVFLAEVSCWMQVEGLSSFALVGEGSWLALLQSEGMHL